MSHILRLRQKSCLYKVDFDLQASSATGELLRNERKKSKDLIPL